MIVFKGGIDVSQDTFDLTVLDENRNPHHRRFQNSSQGCKESIKWLLSLNIKTLDLVLEPTGRYSEAIAEFFYARKFGMRLAQPLMFSRYAESLDLRIKSDFLDSWKLAVYACERWDQLYDWCPKTESEWELRDLQVLFRSLTKRSTSLKCQLQCGLRSKYVEKSIKEELERVECEYEKALDRAEVIICVHPVLSNDLTRLLTLPGIARKSAILLLTLIDFRKFKSARSLACFLGLTSKKQESGTSVRGSNNISKRGNAHIRGKLFMPARTARQFNPSMRLFAERLKGKGKHDWVIQVAVIRKLVTTAWALVVHNVDYQPDYVNPHKSKTVSAPP